MIAHHKVSLEQPVEEIIEGCFKDYADHLDGLEKLDISALKKRMGELKGMQNNLAKDLQETDRSKLILLREREQLLKMSGYSMQKRADDRLRLKCIEK